MRELSLHILDIAQNSLAADASLIDIALIEDTAAHTLRIVIADNGKGMTPEEIDCVLVGQPVAVELDGQQHRGTGLKNVIERLRIYYGIKDVFEIASEGAGRGTAVSIIIPRHGSHVM